MPLFIPDALTLRERQIIELRKTGTTLREIAMTLGIAERSVKAHVRNIALKLGVRRGNRGVTVEILNKLYPAVPNEQKLQILTPREKQCALGVLAGKTNREIGQGIGRPEGEVKNYLRQVFDKTGAFSRVELRELLTESA
jgi:DNA-binding CsgD family transcriptional regulator